MLKRALMLTSGSLLQTNPLTSYSRETAGIVVFLILELHSQTLLEPSLSNSEKDKYYAVDYVNNYYIGRAVSAPTERQFTLTKFLHKIQQTEIKSFGWPKRDDIDHVHSTCVFYGPVELKGNGPFEVLDLQELEAVFQSVS